MSNVEIGFFYELGMIITVTSPLFLFFLSRESFE